MVHWLFARKRFDIGEGVNPATGASRGLDRSSDLSLCWLPLKVNEDNRAYSSTSNCKSSIKLITTTTADPATPAKNMTSKRRMKNIATSIGNDCIPFCVTQDARSSSHTRW